MPSNARLRFRTAPACAAGLGLFLAAGGAIALETGARQMAAISGDLTELSLDALLDLDVVSVSRRAEPLAQAAAAVFVLTGEEIRRSGVRSIADALRMVPGVLVQRTSAQAYTVTARGFSGDKLQVLLDGRSVYTPLTSTVFWDVLHTSDIERIEVIRGPGATLWGANAVNGVINIVTRNAQDSLGTEVHGGGGNAESAFGGLRTGSKLGETGAIRVFVRGFERDHTKANSGADATDGQSHLYAGFRSDLKPAVNQDLSLSGAIYDGRQRSSKISTPADPNDHTDTEVSGGYFLSDWALTTATGSKVSVQASYDRYKLFLPEVFDEFRETYNLEIQHSFALGSRQDIIYGAGFRSTRDRTGGPPLILLFDPAQRTLRTSSAFIQDQIKLATDGELTLGSKFEHNDVTGNEVQPSIRLGWGLGERTFTWGSVSSAVRTPNRLDEDVAIFCSAGLNAAGVCSPAGTTQRIGNADLESEKLTAYEWGLRWRAAERFSTDLALFLNDYTDLRGSETTPPPFGRFSNSLDGRATGGELALVWQPQDWVNLRLFHAYLNLNVKAKPGSTDTRTAGNIEGSSPRQSAGLRFALLPWPQVSVDGFLRHVGRLPALAVESYTELNLRAAYRPWPSFELALVGENLLDPHHPESGSAASASQPQARSGNEIPRSLFVEFIWNW